MFKLLTWCAATIVALTVAASAETLVDRGSYLVNAVTAATRRARVACSI